MTYREHLKVLAAKPRQAKLEPLQPSKRELARRFKMASAALGMVGKQFAPKLAPGATGVFLVRPKRRDRDLKVYRVRREADGKLVHVP